LDIGVKVEANDILERSEVKLYYRIYFNDTIPGTIEYDGTWTLLYTIPIPYAQFPEQSATPMIVKFPGPPISVSSYSARSEAIAFPPGVAHGGGNIVTTDTVAMSKGELQAIGIQNFTPISPQESFILTGTGQAGTVVMKNTFSGQALPGTQRLSNITLKKRLSQGSIDFTYKKPTTDISELANGEWSIAGANNVFLDYATADLEQDEHYTTYFAVQDGSQFDTDGAEDGEITDPTILGIRETPSNNNPSPSNPDDGYQPLPPSIQPTPSKDTKVADFKIVLAGTTYNATTQADGSLLFTVPYGTDITKLKLSFALPAGAKSVPASGSELDFTEPVIYTITAADGVTKQTYTVIVKAQSIASLIPEKGLVSSTGSDWKASVVINKDNTASFKVTVPFEIDLIPDRIAVQSTGLNNLKISLADEKGAIIKTYSTAQNPYALILEGVSASRSALNNSIIQSLTYWFSDSTEYKQTLGLKLGDMKITSEIDNSAPPVVSPDTPPVVLPVLPPETEPEKENKGSSSGGCNGTFGLVGLLLCFALLGLKRKEF
jgi:hypothetical protein